MRVKVEPMMIQTLINFASINPSLSVRAGMPIKTVSPTKDLMARSLMDNPFPTFCVYSLEKFINAMKMFKTPYLEFSDNHVVISDENTQSSFTMYFTDPDNITTPPENDIAFPKPIVSFVLEENVLDKTFTAMRVGKMTDIAICGEGGKLVFKAFDAKGAIKDSFTSIISENTTGKDFRLTFKASNILLIPDAYAVDVCSEGIAQFEGSKAKYWIAVDANSSY